MQSSMPTNSGREAHWSTSYRTTNETEVSWYQDEPAVSLALIQEAAPDRRSRIIDIGGGASVLVDRLLALGYEQPAVQDLSQALREKLQQL